MDNESKRPVCPNCAEVELTKEEQTLLKGKLCYWCYLDMIKQKNLAYDTQEAPKPPEMFGRTEKEVKMGRKGADSLQYGSSAQRYTDGFQDNPDLPPFSPEARALLKGSFNFDPSNPPIVTVIQAKGEEGTSLRLEITAPVSEGWREAIEQILDQELQSIVKMLMYGPKHPNMLKNLNQKLNPGPQFGGFSGGGE